MPETLIESEWLEALIKTSPGCIEAMKKWKGKHYDLPPALRKKG